ncbi:MAG: hypothetical protein JSR59_21480 [Proteobacteria bacterium]|nr:hypothetical protein [Pseudomonadota bacterium]
MDRAKTDLLALFRPPGRTAPLEAESPTYRAFTVAGFGSRATRVQMRPRSGLAFARLHSSLIDIVWDVEDDSEFLLEFPGRLVRIRGKNLSPLIEAMVFGTCESIAEVRPTDRVAAGATVVERIELMTPKAASAPAS